VVTKRLFGVRGGKKAYEARLRSESILQAEIDALAAAPSASGPRPAAQAASARMRSDDSAPGKDPAPGEVTTAEEGPVPHREATAPASREPPTR
jgi:hypothetical protein